LFLEAVLLERIDTGGPLPLLRYTPWENVPGLLQGVTVKHPETGGTEYAHLAEIAAALGFGRLARLHQIHGGRVLDLDNPETEFPYGTPERPDADGTVGGQPGVLGVVSGADCVPVFLLDRTGRRWAVVHAGWRGVVAGVLPESLRAISRGDRKVMSRLELYLGPAICGGCYAVGADVAAQLRVAGGGAGVEWRGGVWYADIRAILAAQARGAGLDSGAVATSGYCTRCHNELFCSFRAEGRAGLGRMWGVIGFRPELLT
jgi:YfiH family protein